MGKGRLRKAWDMYRHIAAIRGLLQWIGLWKYAVFGSSIVVTALTTRIEGVNDLPWPFRLAVYAAIFVGLVVLLLQVAIFIRALEVADEMEQKQPAKTQTTTEGPEVVVDYF